MKTSALIFLLFVTTLHISYSQNVDISSGRGDKYDSQILTMQGKLYIGKFIKEDSASIKFETNDGYFTLLKNNIHCIINGNDTIYVRNNYDNSKPMMNIKTDNNKIVATSNSNVLLIQTVKGETVLGEFVSATDTTVTYKMSSGLLTISKSNILNISKSNNLPTRRIKVKEYNKLPLLILTIGGAAWAISLFTDASDYNKAGDALNALGSRRLADEAASQSNTKTIQGIAVSIASIVCFIVAIKPTEKFIEQPISVIPTSNGVMLAFRF